MRPSCPVGVGSHTCPPNLAPSGQPHLPEFAFQQEAWKGTQGQREATACHLLWALKFGEVLIYQAL